jgi:hypothetical protein
MVEFTVQWILFCVTVKRTSLNFQFFCLKNQIVLNQKTTRYHKKEKPNLSQIPKLIKIIIRIISALLSTLDDMGPDNKVL